MSKAVKSRSVRSVAKQVEKAKKPVGPRVAKWRAEWDGLFARLKRCDPHSEEFREVFGRLIHMNLHQWHVDHERWKTFTDSLPGMVCPELVTIVAKLRKATGEGVSISIIPRLYKDGWHTQVFAWFSRHASIYDPSNVTEEVATVLRREAEALLAMADRVAKTAK